MQITETKKRTKEAALAKRTAFRRKVFSPLNVEAPYQPTRKPTNSQFVKNSRGYFYEVLGQVLI
ncbi:hypothetical protein FFZ96_17130 [Leptospira borgpetersenii]|nr:hypothetical protein LBHB_04050 [Leptospira borgpetersenii serovar Hardjo]TQE51879.1 hypothetical protein FFZ96_17130 [Leptospira borgpetersenii]